jgi:hypothetical protein
MKKVLALILLSVGLCGCTTKPYQGNSSFATPYQASGLFGGYEERRLSENSFKVFFHGNRYTRGERAADFALLRSAEVADQHGFPYFVVAEEEAPAASSRGNTIICFKEKPERPGVIHDAKSVQQSIREKYKISSASQ